MRFFVLCLLFSSELLFAGIKFRAREHFGIHDITQEKKVHRYFGLSNTLNFGLEERSRYYYSLYLNPILGSAKLLKSADAFYGENIKLLMIGVEAKQHWEPLPAFFRFGVGWTRLLNDTKIEPDGVNVYLGVGYEWEFYKGIAMVPELAIRNAWLEEDTKIQTATFSLAFHFYDFNFFGE